MSYAQCNGCRIAYQQFGEGPDLIMIHGLATNRAFWFADLAQRLKAHYRVTLYDLRGHGYSERTEGGYGAQDMAIDLLELLDQLSIEQADVVGHSYGGGVGLELAVLAPQRVRSLALLDTKINRLQPEQRLADSDYLSAVEQDVLVTDGRDWSHEKHVGLKYLEVMARLRLDGYESSTRDQYTPFGAGRGGLRTAKQYVTLLDETRAGREFCLQGACSEELAALRVPLLLMYGEFSRCLPSGRAMLGLHDDARFCIVPQAGHFFPASHPNVVMRELGGFLGLERAGRALAPSELLRNVS